MDDLKAGIEHFNAGRFGDALRIFQTGRSPQARVFAAHALSALGRRDEAVAALEAAGKDRAARAALAAILRTRALDRRAAGDLGSAEADFARVLALAPKDAGSRRAFLEVRRMREQAALAAGDLAGAEALLREGLTRPLTRAASRASLIDVLRRRAGDHADANRLPEAEAILREAYALDPASSKTRRFLAEVLGTLAARSEQNPRRAEAIVRRALRLIPDDPRNRRLLLRLERSKALRAWSSGRTSAAERALRNALALDPRDAKSLRLRKQIGELKERLKRAEETAARQRHAERVRAATDELRACAQAYKPAARLRHAVRLYDKLLRLDPGNARARAIVGGIFFCAGKSARGRAYLKEALRLDRGTLSTAERFMALMKLGRYQDALRCAERILDGTPGLDDLRAFWDPWEWDERRPRGERLRELGAFTRAVGTKSYAPWLAYYQADLGGPEDLSRFERLSAYSLRRYGWMYAKSGLAALCSGRYALASDWLSTAVRGGPIDWRTYGFLAEAYLCLGRPALARSAMNKAARAAPKNEGGQVLAWKGALELWSGDYREARETLTEAARLGAPYAPAWLGGALLKLGRPAEALQQLDDALSRYPLDYEAYVWRGEAKRALGLNREALKDLSEAAAPVGIWARFNRALAKQALGDLKGMKADFTAIPSYVLDYVREKAGLPADYEPTPANMAKVLEAGLVLSRGFRREEYRQAVWLK